MERVPTALDAGPAQALVTLATGAWRQAVLAVAVRLDLCAMLGARDADLEEVCYSLGTRRHPMRLFLGACEGLGLVIARDDAYRLGPLGAALRDAAGGGSAAWARATGDVALADSLEAALVEPLLTELPAAAGTRPGELAAGAPEGTGGFATAPPRTGIGLPAEMPRPGAGAGMPTADDWEALHTAAAAALATALALPAEGLALEIGGRGTFLRACLGRAPGLTGALVVGRSPGAAGGVGGTLGVAGGVGEARGAAGADGQAPGTPRGGAGAPGTAAGGGARDPDPAALSSGGIVATRVGAPAAAGADRGADAAGVSARWVQVPALEALGASRARLALVVHPVDAGGAAVLRARLMAVRDYLVPDALVAVVGGFLPPTPGRPLAPLLGLAALASGRAAWCPPAAAVAEQLRASGYTPSDTLVLPEPDVALLARA